MVEDCREDVLYFTVLVLFSQRRETLLPSTPPLGQVRGGGALLNANRALVITITGSESDQLLLVRVAKQADGGGLVGYGGGMGKCETERGKERVEAV